MSYFGSLRNFISTHPESSIGCHTYGDFELHYWDGSVNSQVNIGNFCSIGGNNKLYLGGNHRHDYVTTFPFGVTGLSPSEIGIDGSFTNTSNGNIVMGSDVWFGDNCVVMSGINIGHGAVVANSSVVTKNVLPYAIVGGNPAKIIKFRFPEEIIRTLLEIAWWNWSDEKISHMKKHLYSADVERFIIQAKL